MIQEQAYQIFLEEAPELLNSIEVNLLTLRQEYGISKVHCLVQAADLIKQGAVDVGLTGIQTLAQWLKNVFLALYRKNSKIDSELEDLLLKAYFSIRLPLLSQIQTGNYDEVGAIAKAKPIFAQLEAQLGSPLEATADLLVTDKLEAGVTKSILENDFTLQLERLETLLAHPETENLEAELRTVAKEFAAWGRLLNIPSFVTLAHTILTLLLASPEAVLAIGRLALKEFQAIQKAVLQGEHTLGWELSPEWAEFTANLGAILPSNPAPSTSAPSTPAPSPALPPDLKRNDTQKLWQAAPSGLSVPKLLKLKTAELFVCQEGSIVLTFPFANIAEIVNPQADQLKQGGKQRFLYWRERMIPVYRISDLLDDSHFLAPIASSSTNQAIFMLVFSQDNQNLALELKIDRLVTEPELVITSFGGNIFLGQNDPSAPPDYVYGWMLLQKGKLATVIDGAVLLNQMLSKTINKTISTTNIAPASSVAVINSHPRTISVKSSPSATLLVVDDSRTIRKILELTLQQVGYQVLQAQDGEKAIEQLQKNPIIKLVICDVDMPKMNGFEFLYYCRRQPQLGQVPVVILTSQTSEQHRQLAMRLGARAYFTKPCMKEQLLAAIKTLLDD